jgi:hypothetical protein
VAVVTCSPARPIPRLFSNFATGPPEARDRAATAILKALFAEFTEETADGQQVCLLRAGEIADAYLNTMAWVLSTSEATSTPTKLREHAEGLRKSFIQRVRAAQEYGVPAGMDVIHMDGLQ